MFHQELLASALPGRPSKQALKPLVVDHETPQYLRMFAWWLLLQACHAQGQRPLRHQASRRAASRPQARSQADTVQDNRGRPKLDAQKACCGCVLFGPVPKTGGGQFTSMANCPRDYLLPAPATHFHGCRNKELGYEQGEGRNHTRLSKVKLSNVSLAETLHVFI